MHFSGGNLLDMYLGQIALEKEKARQKKRERGENEKEREGESGTVVGFSYIWDISFLFFKWSCFWDICEIGKSVVAG